jgi:hypothetical protein
MRLRGVFLRFLEVWLMGRALSTAFVSEKVGCKVVENSRSKYSL